MEINRLGLCIKKKIKKNQMQHSCWNIFSGFIQVSFYSGFKGFEYLFGGYGV